MSVIAYIHPLRCILLAMRFLMVVLLVFAPAWAEAQAHGLPVADEPALEPTEPSPGFEGGLRTSESPPTDIVLLDRPPVNSPEVPDQDVGCANEVAAADAPSPAGRAIANLDAAACHRLLEARGVPFQGLSPEEARGVGIPIRLTGELDGIVVSHRGGSELHEIVDCRLAVAILEWAPLLREAGITALRHYSIYRPGAQVARSGRVSGHAHGMAIDLGRIERDGEQLAVLDGWESRERGADPCVGPFEESEASARLRAVVCQAVERDLFQVVLTPHHDRAHQNHVHLEVRPGVDWSYVH